ncbi:MmcB family DNA repair protein [Microbaculum marinum]|uniref:MmcB family DNA repair protein n=1 Tax=Microbaculum marinum TaxID=1764581 RepID=A0AAW9RJK7_9HYPH
MFAPSTAELLADGRQSEAALAVQRGTGRLLRALGFSLVTELPLASGRRADIVALSPRGDFWIVEIKSSLADLRADAKWPEYRLHCDRLFFAAPPALGREIFPAEAGFIAADAYGAEILDDAPEHRLSGATRRAMMLRFARCAALRLHGLADPTMRFDETAI